MTSPATQPARFATRRLTRQLVPGHRDHEQERPLLPSRPPPKSSRPSAHASLIADLFDRALGDAGMRGRSDCGARSPGTPSPRGRRMRCSPRFDVMPPDQLVPELTLVTKPRPLDTDEDTVQQAAWSADGQWFWTAPR